MLGFVFLSLAVAILCIFGGGIFVGVTVIVAVMCCAGCLLYRGQSDRRDRTLIILAIGTVGILVLTVLPIPPWMEMISGPTRVHQNQTARQALNLAADQGVSVPVQTSFCISRNRAGTMRGILLFIAAFAAATLSSRLPGVWKERYIKMVVITGVVVAILGGIGQWIWPQGKTIWWFFKVLHGQPVACFLNRNHFGGFIAMLCPAAVILFADAFGRRRLWASAFWAGGFGMMSLAAIMSLSRGAWLAYAVSILAVAILLLVHKRILMAIAVVLLMGLIVVGIARLPHDERDKRVRSMADVSQTQSGQMRMSTWFDTIMIMPDYLLLGTGLNGFRMVFPQYRTATTRASFKHAENEYLQLLVELGIIGYVMLAALLWRCMVKWRHIHLAEGTRRIVAFSVGGALIVAAVHAVFDFAIRIPLYNLVLASFVGLTITPCSKQLPSYAMAGRRLTLAPMLGLVAAIAIGLYGRQVYVADSSDHLMSADSNTLCRRLTWSPTSWQVWYHLGRSALADPSIDGLAFGHDCISKATEYDPNNYRLWAEVCRVRLSMGDKKGARIAHDRLRQLRKWVKIRGMEGTAGE